MKKVSIIIPTFNQGAYLPTCIDHCLFQTYDDIEIIIVDGGSNDSTKVFLNGLKHDIASKTISPVKRVDSKGEIFRERELVFPQNRDIKILSFDHDIGATRTYNEGFRKASGEYCTYIVGDDIPHPHMIEALVYHLERTNADFVYSDMNLVDDCGRILRQIRLQEYDFNTCLAQWFHLGVSKLYRTSLHNTVGLMDEKNFKSANDYDHYLRFAMHGAVFSHLPKVLYSVRHHGESRKTGQHTKESYANLLNESAQCAKRARQWAKNCEKKLPQNKYLTPGENT